MEKELKNPDIRRINDLEKVLYDKEWFSQNKENFEIYHMYRGIKEKDGLRYDITEVTSKMFGVEYPKTKGHYHPGDYGEIYMVIEGKAIYLLQNRDLSDIVYIEVNPGEVAIIPPGYGHVTINCTDKPLKMANWVSPDFNSLYEPFLEKEGAAYFYTTEGWVKNEKYGKIPEIRKENSEKELPKDLNFLK